MGLGHGNSLSWWNLTGGTDSSRTYIAKNKVVQSGLVLNLDAGASTSYVGSGTTWTDLSDSGSVSAATAALPIYNTTDTIGAVKGTGTRTDANASSLVLAIPMDGANNGTTFIDESLNIKNPSALPIYNTTDIVNAVKGTGTRTDAFASSLVLAVPMDGANNGTTFTDESATIKGSGSAKTLTRTGFINSTTQSKFYGSSGYSDTNYNSITASSSSDFDFGTGNFTIECYVYPVTISTYGIIFQTAGSNTVGSAYFLLNPIGTAVLETYTGGARPNVSQTGVITNAWNHIAVVRSGSNCTVYVNGIAGSSTTFTYSLTSTTPRIGSNSDESGNGRFNGYIQDLRVYKGVAKYTSNFGVPGIGAKTITRNGAFTSTAVSKFYGSSGFFDGTGDFLETASSENLRFGTSDFTIECWVYFNTLNVNTTVLRMAAGNGFDGILFCHSSNAVYITSNGSSWDIINGSVFTGLTTGAWTHLSLTRSGSTFRGFVNGTVVFTVTSSASIYQSSPIARIGCANSDGSFAMNGYLQDLRIYKGLAKYTANFTPPGIPNNATLTNGPTYNSANGGSIVFDGSNDYVDTFSGSGLSTFTVAIWVKTSTTASNATFFQRPSFFGKSSGGAASGDFGITISNGFVGYWSGLTTGDASYLSSVLINDGIWKYIVVTNTGSVASMYLNGSQLSDSSLTINGVSLNSENFWIGARGGSETPGSYCNCEISNVKVYNRALSATEVTQNFNALRGRFGV